MSDLLSPITIGPLTLPNRLIIPPMCQYSSETGEPQDWHFVHYGQLAISGAGLLIIEATAVEKEGRISPHDLGLWSDGTKDRFLRMMECIRSVSNMPLSVQLSHAGRKGSKFRPWEGNEAIPYEQGGWQVSAPSSERFCPMSHTPRPMDGDDINRVRGAFAAAATRADSIGFDAVELHFAHGYLVHEFLSPLTNRRDDAYGGSLENRMRFALEIFDAVRAVFSTDKPVGVRISATDWVDDGWDINDSVTLAKELGRRGCAYIHVSSGGLSPDEKIRTVPGYQVGMAARIKRETGLPTIAVGLITEPEQAQTIIETGQADMVAVGRGMLFNPRWPWLAALRLGQTINAPLPYIRSAPGHIRGLFV